MNIAVTTYPYGHVNKEPRELLESLGNVTYNTHKRKMDTDELKSFLKRSNPDIIIGGTDIFSPTLLNFAMNLKLISRVGIGLDGIDFDYCKEHDIKVAYTPDAPSNAVAELTICQILNMLRKVQNVSDDLMHKERWNRYIGRELKNCTIGVIGYGRIGFKVDSMLHRIGCRTCHCDTLHDSNDIYMEKMGYILESCDIITIHIPLEKNKDFITRRELNLMKSDVRLLNMSRGGIINEEDLYNWLRENKKACAAVDTFENEAYSGKLRSLGNAYLTPHLGSCTVQSRYDMEMGAAEEAKRFIGGEKLLNEVVK